MRVTTERLKEGCASLTKVLKPDHAAGRNSSWWLKVVGFYLVVILILIKFVAIPLHGRLEGKEKVLAEYAFSVKDLQRRLDAMAARKDGAAQGRPLSVSQEMLYPKGTIVYAIQGELLQSLFWAAENHGMAVVNFELQVPTPVKSVSEIPILLNLKGPPRAATAFLGELDSLRGKPDFTKEQFVGPFTVEKLCQALQKESYALALKSSENRIEWLNEVLTIPNFYDIVTAKKKDMDFPKELIDLVQKTASYRKERQFANLANAEQSDIRRLNRLVIEEVYPGEAPKGRLGKAFAVKNLQIDFAGNEVGLHGLFVTYRREK